MTIQFLQLTNTLLVAASVAVAAALLKKHRSQNQSSMVAVPVKVRKNR